MERWHSIRSRPEAPWGHPRRSALARRDQPACQSAIGYPSSGGVSGFSYLQNFATLSLRARSPELARDQASAVGVGSGSDCGGAARERARLCFVLVGFGAASTTSGFDPEAGV
jgi:hypothetical protein